jgi:hypothetical protein
MKTQDYNDLITKTNKSAEEILRSKTNRDDPLPEICANLVKKQKVIPIPYPRHNSWVKFPGFEAFMWIYYLDLKLATASKNKFLIYFHDTGKNMLKLFLKTIERQRPIYVTINDDWPKNNKAYKKCINVLNEWRNKHISNIQPWEII